MRRIGGTSGAGHSPRPARKKRKILYIEDNDDNWVVAELRLGSEFTLIRASTDREACAYLRDHGAELSAVLVDIELQGSTLNGVEIVKILRGHGQSVPVPAFAKDMPKMDTPILFLTAYGQVYSEAMLRAAGGDGLVPKPVDFKKLNMLLMRLQVSRL